MKNVVRFLRRVALTIPVLYSISCVSQGPSRVSTYREAEAGCNIALLSSGKEQLGTLFKLQVGQTVAYVTTAHSFPGIKTKELTITYKCQGLIIKQKVIALESLPGIDAAIVRPAKLISELPSLQPSVAQVGAITIPNYPLLSSFAPQLADTPIESSGSVISVNEGTIYFLASILRPGASGAPLLDNQGRVVGILVGRFMEENVYAGVGYGYSIEKLLRAISARSATTSSTSNNNIMRHDEQRTGQQFNR